jgi:hypothetical protein
MPSVPTFAAVQASVHNPLNAERRLTSRPNPTLARTATLAEQRELCAA